MRKAVDLQTAQKHGRFCVIGHARAWVDGGCFLNPKEIWQLRRHDNRRLALVLKMPMCARLILGARDRYRAPIKP